jgi:hypothetical protein
MIYAVNFTAGVLSNAYRFWFCTMRGMRDGGGSMCF